MTLLLLATALAIPPVPTWTDTPQGPAEEAPEAPVEAGTNEVARPIIGVRQWEPNDDRIAAWSDEENLVLSLSGDVGTMYYLMGTVRGEGLLAHWRQGPIAGENLTIDVPVQLPAELAEPIEALGTVHLSVKIAATTLNGADLAQQSAGRTHVYLIDGRPMGAGPSEAEGTIDDLELQLPDDKNDLLEVR